MKTNQRQRRGRTSERISNDAGQVLVVGFDGTEMSAALRSLVDRLQPGGVILFARNITAAAQTHTLLEECQSQVATALFRCVDLEGGKVDRFRNALGATPSPADVFATGQRRLFRKHGQLIGENCQALGFNVDFAPSVDLAFEASRSVMGSRAVSADPREVISYAREFLAGLHSAGVLGCAKHFPGLGEGRLDSHHELPVIAKAWKALWEQDLAPYRNLKRALPFVMVSHAAYPAVTGDQTPASLSAKWITEVLRKKIGFQGLIASDDLEMGGVLTAAPIEEAAVAHIRAGGNLCLLCHKEEGIVRSYEALIRQAERDPAFARRLAGAARRVREFKRKRKISARMKAAPNESAVERHTRRLWEFSEEVRMATIERQESA